MAEPLDDATLAVLRSVDTPTVCNALEIAQGGRRATGFTREMVIAADPYLPPIVGVACTARLRAASPADMSREEMRRRRLAYYEYVAAGPGPNVVVIEDCDGPRPVGAYWGEVNVAIHKGLGIAGTVTNGLMRDLNAIDEGYQILAGGVGPSHAFVHILETDCPVTVFGMSVRPTDLIHADRHGAVVIPGVNIGAMVEAIAEVERSEAPILAAARRSDFNIETLRKVWAGFNDVH